MLKQLKSRRLKSRIIKILTENPSNRDNDHKLISNIWFFEFREQSGKHPNEVTAFEFMRLVSLGRLTNPESIRRLRQKIQEQYPGLRGSKYMIRQNHTKKVRKEINKNNQEI
jgi:hypothetical protein